MNYAVHASALVLLIIGCSGCVLPRAVPAGGGPERDGAFSCDEVAPAPARALCQALVWGTDSEQIWPGFRLSQQVLIVTAQPAGPVVLYGDSAPPPDYRPIDRVRGIWLREGPPPDSLAGLRIALKWDGRERAGTAVDYYDQDTPQLLIHEAFHTFQRQRRSTDPGRFHTGRTPSFPDTVVEAVALLTLEGRHLAEALSTPSDADARQAILSALAIRNRRCTLISADECDRERDIEQNEGSAEYVTLLLAESGRMQARRDSLQRTLAAVPDLNRLRRFHFYDVGLTWLLLLDRLGPMDWKERVERHSLDQVFAEHLSFSSERTDSLVTTAMMAWNEALQDAQEVVGAELARRAAAERAFWSQPGIPLRLYWKSNGSVSSSLSLTPSGERQLGMRFGKGGDWVQVRTDYREVCCPVALVTMIPVTGQAISVSGKAMSLDHPGITTEGPVRLDLPGITLELESARVEVHADSVSVRMR